MRLTDLFSRGRKLTDARGESEAPARVGNDDRSSMADLVRLLKEADNAQQERGRQPA